MGSNGRWQQLRRGREIHLGGIICDFILGCAAGRDPGFPALLQLHLKPSDLEEKVKGSVGELVPPTKRR